MPWAASARWTMTKWWAWHWLILGQNAEAEMLAHLSEAEQLSLGITDMRARLRDMANDLDVMAHTPKDQSQRRRLQLLAYFADTGNRGLLSCMLIATLRAHARQGFRPTRSDLRYIPRHVCSALYPECGDPQYDLLTSELLDELQTFGLMEEADPASILSSGYWPLLGIGYQYEVCVLARRSPLAHFVEESDDARLDDWLRHRDEFMRAKLYYRQNLNSILGRSGRVGQILGLEVNVEELNQLVRSGQLIELIEELGKDSVFWRVVEFLDASPIVLDSKPRVEQRPSETIAKFLAAMLRVARWLQAASTDQTTLTLSLIDAYAMTVTMAFDLRL
jgi:hypothetical protein